ncbi:MAG: ComEA family DNA-binding protein [Desulforhopalus sp.]
MLCNKSTSKISFIATILLVLAFSPAVAADKSSSSLTGIAQQAVSKGSLGETININSATPEMLSAIPGVGPQIGEAITKYREANGAFTQIKDLLNVEGIDEKLLEAIKPFIKL